MSPAAETQQQVVTYTPIPTAEQARDLLLLEQEDWGECGELTWGGLVRYMRDLFRPPSSIAGGDPFAVAGGGENYVDCCGYGADLRIPLYVYELVDGVIFDLQVTAGELDRFPLETIEERDTASFALTREVDIRHPAQRIIRARWLTGPWTTGGADVPAPELTVDGRTVRSPIPLFGLVELTLEVRRWKHVLNIPADEAEELLVNGWAEFAVVLVDGGRPVGLEITPPPGAEELAKNGEECGRGGHYKQKEPEDEEPVAQPEDKIIRCEYCEAKCDDEDEKGDEE